MKRHAHLQTLIKTPAKFQKDPGKIVGVGFTRYPVSISFKPKISKFKLVKRDKN